MPQPSDVIPRPNFEPPLAEAAGAQAGFWTGLATAVVASVGIGNPGPFLPLTMIGFLVGTLGGVFFDRVSRSRDSALFPLAFGVLGGLSGSLTLATLPPPQAAWVTAPLLTAGLALACGGVGGALLGASAGVFAGRRDPENPLPASGRAALVAGLGTAGFLYALVYLGAGVQASGPLSTAILTLVCSLQAVGPVTLGLVGALAAGAGTLLAAGRQAWIEQDLPSAPILSGELLHESSEGYRALLLGDDPTVH